jgi:hypothetical protein
MSLDQDNPALKELDQKAKYIIERYGISNIEQEVLEQIKLMMKHHQNVIEADLDFVGIFFVELYQDDRSQPTALTTISIPSKEFQDYREKYDVLVPMNFIVRYLRKH